MERNYPISNTSNMEQSLIKLKEVTPVKKTPLNFNKFASSSVKFENLKTLSPLRKSYSTPRRRFRRINIPRNERRRLSLDLCMVPKYKGYQLIGDSQFVRFSERMLSMKKYVSYADDTNSRAIGYCVSGQKIENLRIRLTERNYNVHSHVIMMIGTNDIVYETDVAFMCKSYNEILAQLQEKCQKIVLLTVPPVPKLETLESHWRRLKFFNKFIQEKADNEQIFVIDLCNLFIGYGDNIISDYFEKFFYPSNRPDLIHLNLRGFTILKTALDTLYFHD